MLSECSDKKSKAVITNADDMAGEERSKKETVVSLRSLVKQKIDFLPGGNCSLKGAEIRVETDDQGRTLPRVYLKYGRYQVGWVLNNSTSSCLLCKARFGTFLRRHHCRSCGLLMCHSCSKRKDLVNELDVKKKTRICDLCVAARAEKREDDSQPQTDTTMATPVVVQTCTDDPEINSNKAPESQNIGCLGHSRACHEEEEGKGSVEEFEYEKDDEGRICQSQSQDVSDVTDPAYDQCPVSTVSPSLVKKLALVGFDGDNNSSDEEDTLNSPSPSSPADTQDNSGSQGVIENDSFLSASGSSLGDESAARYYFQGDSSISGAGGLCSPPVPNPSPMACSVSPIRKRQPMMRSPSGSRPGRSVREHAAPTADLRSDLLQEQERPLVSRRRSIGEIFGLKTKKSQQQGGNVNDESDGGSDVEGYADLSASGSSLGDDSARRFFMGGYNSSALNSPVTLSSLHPHGSPNSFSSGFNSLSPDGQDVVVHDTFHSPSFTATGKTRSYTAAASLSTLRPAEHLDKENWSSNQPVPVEERSTDKRQPRGMLGERANKIAI